MMRVARAGVGVDCGGGNATERELWTQQQHILTQETEEAVLSSSFHTAHWTRLCSGPPHELLQLHHDCRAKNDDMSEVRECKEKRAGWSGTDSSRKRGMTHERNMMEGGKRREKDTNGIQKQRVKTKSRGI